ncbi:NADH-quinone oxidoreductase subunit NuoK [Buchnera aphidicola]|uniref:NADH-quinone oxidoreductase subunit K n=1 Tax=Buchnera aphidicola subsp. Cinara cedri (strain Cc) TaxID=372461 RepID=NUOK_BUCCC|nr:NADH-quinone oxidoreductase subunit NuoK [Buchnera aphidicola]Q057W6.1 RecName: Full=NADH-quinone oxidoreductase subunit K; AltName: Full=NADH dehydrogenase I subunit K; AltName: Full=NDH-1 subunit K [Buchnera aphidicola BCc]ABJ90583.1 NADH dehydrogenase I chain K [Buchnera aphidicola BCc]
MLSLNYGFTISIILFFIGIISLLIHKNLIFILVSLEVLINSIILGFILIGKYWKQIDCCVLYIFIVTIATVEVSVMLAIFLRIYQRYHTLDIYKLREISK